MNTPEFGRSLRRNVLSSYAALAQRLVTGAVSFRILYSSLDKEEFGYWALLWSVFGYGMLIDFGFGITVQKRVAQLAPKEAWEELNRSLSTIFYSYCFLAVIVGLLGWFFADAWVRAMGVSPENREEFAVLFRVFLGAMALMFPLGLFTEVLQGMQRIALNNVITMVVSLIGFAFLVWSLLSGMSLTVILGISVAGPVLTGFVRTLYSFRILPQLRIFPSLFSKGELRSTMNFSFVAYFIMISYVVMTKTDLLVLSSMMAVSAVAIYQPGAKISELYTTLTKQLAYVLQPAAAHLYATGTRTDIANLLIGGIRYSVLLSTPVYLGVAFYLDVLLRVFTGESNPSREMFWVGQTLLLWSHTFVITHNVYKRIALMGGHERRLLWIGVLEAVLNLGVSIVAVLIFNAVLGVALGTLLPTLLIGWGVLWGWSATEAGVTRFELFRQSLAATWLANLPMLGVLIVLHYLGWTRWSIGPVILIGGMIVATAVGLGFTWRIGLTPSDRQMVLSKLPFLSR